MSGYRLSVAAQNDLREISRYTKENWGNKQAKHYLVELAAGIENIARSPKLGKVRDEIEMGIRSFTIARHVVFYRKGTECIEIARVLHASMDIKRHLT
ncbi:MAG: type II toxin-antitoxin system RelE/ParE family toxin [Planctomycetota bacterium]|jgi:toxin ParE1/3/4